MDDQGRSRKDLHSDIPDHPPVNRFSSWEEQLLIEADNEASYEVQSNNYQRTIEPRLWFMFQSTATAIAQLHREGHQDEDGGWEPFQHAAFAVTKLYREFSDALKTTRELATQCGHQRRNKEFLAWTRKRKRNIRREDVLNFICGRSPHRTTTLTRSSKQSPHPHHPPHEHDLQQFHEAVSLQGLSGAMAGISVCSQSSSPNPRSQRSPPIIGFPLDIANPEERSNKRNDPSPSTSSLRGHFELTSSRKRNPSTESSNSDCLPICKRQRK